MHMKIQETNISITTLNIHVHKQGRNTILINKFKTTFKGTQNTVICYFGISTDKIQNLKASNPK